LMWNMRSCFQACHAYRLVPAVAMTFVNGVGRQLEAQIQLPAPRNVPVSILLTGSILWPPPLPHRGRNQSAGVGIKRHSLASVRILPARHIEQPRRHAVHPCAPTMPGEILAAAARWQRRSSDANRLCCAVSTKSAGILRQYPRILIPTDSAVRVLPPQPRSRPPRCAGTT